MENIINSMELYKKYSFKLHGHDFEVVKFGSDVIVEIKNHVAGVKNLNDFELGLKIEILKCIKKGI